MSIKVENVSFTYSKKTPNSYEAVHNVIDLKGQVRLTNLFESLTDLPLT